MADLPTLSNSSPEDFINYYFNNLKSDLGVFNVEIAKVGLIGFLMNVLGNTHFDQKMYYDGLFKEAFIATAQNEETQNLHASIYGYLPGFANPATANGVIEFDFNTCISTKQSDVVKREVFLGYRVVDGVVSKISSSFDSVNYKFTIDAIYKFVEDRGNNPLNSPSYFTEVLTADGTKLIIPSASASISVPLYSTTQYNFVEYFFQIPKYSLGSYQTYYFTINSGYYLSDVKVYITPPGGTEEQYDIQYVKYLAGGNDKVVFLKKLSATNYMIEFGSGIRGVWASQYTARIVVEYCEGTAGNLIDSTSTKIPVIGETILHDYTYNSITGGLVPTATSPSLLNNIVVDFLNSSGGTNTLTGENLRKEIVNFIQTRNNLISEVDYYNLAVQNGFSRDFKFLFKKVNVFDNIFYLYRAFRDKNQDVSYTTNHLIPVVNTNLSPTSLAAVSAVDASGTLIPGNTYAYRVDAYDLWGRCIPCTQVSLVLAAFNNSVYLTWDAMDNAVGYRVYGRTSVSQSMYWNTTDLFFTDVGSAGTTGTVPATSTLADTNYNPIFYLDNAISCVPNATDDLFACTNNGLSDDNVVTFSGTGGGVTVGVYYYIVNSTDDTFQISLTEGGSIIDLVNTTTNGFYRPFISPFFYKGNNRMGYFDGYILDQSLLVQFSEFIPSASVIGTGLDNPAIYLNLNYNISTKQTTIKVKSYQNISTYSFKITIFGYTSISDVSMVWTVGTSSFDYVYINSSTFGILENEMQIEVVAYQTISGVTTERFRSRTSKFYQLTNISDQLRLFRYINGTDMYIINVPVIYYGTYIEDSDYYLDKLYQFMISNNFQKTRMITDIVQGRFLNTYIFASPAIEANLVQRGEVFTDYNWLDDVMITRDRPYTTLTIGDRYKVSDSPYGSGAFNGHAKEIAEYTSTGWSFYSPSVNDGVYDSDAKVSTIWGGSSWGSIPSIRLPLKMTVDIKLNKDFIDRNPMNLGQAKDQLNLMLAQHLQRWRTGVDVKFYNSQIVDIIHDTGPWIKSVIVSVTDSSQVPNNLNSGIEMVSVDTTVLSDLPDKFEILKYVPAMLFWDINDIVINLSL